MKTFIGGILALAMLPSLSWAQGVVVERMTVTDGDTVKIWSKALQPFLGARTKGTPVRIRGIQAPETRRYKCLKEKALGLEAKKTLIALVGTLKGFMVADGLECCTFGRLLADVYIGGVNVADEMVKKKMAVYWLPGQPRPDWCD